MRLNQKRWRVLAASCLINLCLGSIYTWSVFAAPMAEYLSRLTGMTITSGDLAIVYTVANSVGPITMISGGWFNDCFGPRKVILIGGTLFSVGMFLSGFASSVTYMIVTYGLLTGLGLGMTYGCTISTCVKYFPDKRGIVGGITTAVYGMGSVILPPIITAIVEISDATVAFRYIGAAFFLIITVCTMFIEKCPDDFLPEGWTPAKKSVCSMHGDLDWKGMLSTPVFYVMIVLLTCGAFSGMMIISQASAVAQDMIGMSALAASSAVSILALFNTFGRIAAGYLSDHIGRVHTLAIACAVSVCGLLLLFMAHEGDFAKFYIGVSIVGLCFGSFMGVFPGFTADQFGPRYNSVNYGFMFSGFALAGYFGPTVMRGIHQTCHSYQPAFVVAACLSLAGLGLTGLYRIVNRIYSAS